MMKFFLPFLFLCLSLSASIKDFDFDKNPYRPIISQAELPVYQEMKAFFETNKVEALRLLKEKTTAERSASFDYIEGILLLDLNRHVEAATPLKKALKKMPRFIDARRALAQVYFHQEKTDEARVELVHIIAAGFGDAEIWSTVAQLYHQQGNTYAAETAYRNALVFSPNKTSLLSSLAQLYLEKENFIEAQSLLKTLLKKDIKSRSLRLALISAQISLGKTKEALSQFEILRRYHKLSGQELVQMASLADELENPELVSRYCLLALKDTKLSADAKLYCLQSLLFDQKIKAFENELKSLDTANLKKGKLVSLRLLQARFLQDEKHLKEAEAVYQDLLKQDSLQGDALLALAQLYQSQKKWQKSIPLLQRLARQKSHQLSALPSLAQAWIELKQWDLGIEAVEKIIELKPQSKRYRLYLESLKAYRDSL